MPSLSEMAPMRGSNRANLSGMAYSAPRQPIAPRKVFGYEMREPFDSEHTYFKANPNVAGMAAEDGKITLNPYSTLNPAQKDSVAANEASRLFMREQGYKFDFPVTPEQMEPFKAMGAEYAKPENYHHLQSTILARIISGDSSAGNYTPQQKQWADKIKLLLQKRQ